MKTGDGSKLDTDIGPLISASAVENVRSLTEDAIKKGAEILYDSHSQKDNLICGPMTRLSQKKYARLGVKKSLVLACLRTFKND